MDHPRAGGEIRYADGILFATSTEKYFYCMFSLTEIFLKRSANLVLPVKSLCKALQYPSTSRAGRQLLHTRALLPVRYPAHENRRAYIAAFYCSLRAQASIHRAAKSTVPRRSVAIMAPKDRDVLPSEYGTLKLCQPLLTSVSVKPINYKIELFDLELGGAFSFQ